MKKILLNILYLVIGIVVILLVAGLFIKKEYTVEREIEIKKPSAEVFNYIKFLRNQDNFSKWAKMDPNMKKSYKGTDGTVGFVSAWESKKDEVGKGEQTITEIHEGERINFHLHFYEPFDGLADAYMTTDSVDTATTNVKWAFESKMKYPMNVTLLFMNMDKMIGNDLETGLKNLKALMEKE